jgi:competence protein ComFC
MRQYLKKILNHVVIFFFPITCINCGTSLPDNDYLRICQKCFDKIELIKGKHCRKCGKFLPDGGEHCYSCRKKPFYHFEFIRSAGEFKGILRELIHKFKYQNKDYCDRIFGRLFENLLNKEKIMKEVDCVTAVPMHWIKKFLRGYNQSDLLAGKVSEFLGKPNLRNVLIRKKMTKPQFGLDKKQRIKNVENSIIISKPEFIKGKKLLLIDDVATTCATIEQCAFVLKKAGADKIYALTIARD